MGGIKAAGTARQMRGEILCIRAAQAGRRILLDECVFPRAHGRLFVRADACCGPDFFFQVMASGKNSAVVLGI